MIPLVVVPAPEDWAARAELPAGSMWRAPENDRPERESYGIVLPNSAGVWYTTEIPGGYTNEDNHLWNVTGDPPNITVTPSINAECRFTDGRVEGWHGFITSGQLV